MSMLRTGYFFAKMTTRVVHCKREKYDIYIGRPSKWGNPFSEKDGTLAEFKVATREQAIEMFEAWILTQPELMNELHTLKDKVLGCWCAPKACHGDVLIRLINCHDKQEQ